MKQLRDKRALVTGAASGIGRAIALRLAREGVHLALVDCNAEGLSAVADEVRHSGVEALIRQCDLSDEAATSAAVRFVLDRCRGVDVLVNNAGVTYYGRTHLMTAEQWRRVMAINLLAPIQIARELLPQMLAREEGHIVNMASICGLVGMARVAAYTTSKFGLVGFSETLRAEYARKGIGVTAVCPGLVDTNLFAAADRGRDLQANIQPPRWLLTTPEQIAERTLRAIIRNQGLVVIQPYARMAYWLKRFAPWALDLGNRFHRSKKKPAAGQVPAEPPQRKAA